MLAVLFFFQTSFAATKLELKNLDQQHLIQTSALKSAVEFFNEHTDEIKNKNYLSVIDYSKDSQEKRFFIIDLKNGEVESMQVAHGKGSDPKHTGRAKIFSNTAKTKATSLGFFLTGGTYQGDHGLSLRLNGKSKTNSNAYDRAIVIHGAAYVNEKLKLIGRSWGCPAVAEDKIKNLVSKLKDGSLIYAYF